jgi:hypothetical protein
MHKICVQPHLLFPSIHGSMQFVWYIMAGYLFISSDTVTRVRELEPHLATNVLQMTCKALWSVDDGRSAFWLHSFTTP